MTITNKSGLPEAIVRAVEYYDKEYKQSYNDYEGLSISTTTLLNPPIQYWLKQRHGSEIVEDVSDRIWAMYGNAVHNLLEQSATEDAITEQSLYYEIEEGKRVTGKPDLIENGTIYDYKTTSVWSIIYNSSMESWTNQLNIYKFLAEKNGIETGELKIVAFLRDWNKNKAEQDSNYPQSKVVVINIAVLPEREVEKMIVDRFYDIVRHEYTKDQELPTCSAKDRWQDDTKYAVMKKGRKRAVKIHSNFVDADYHCIELGDTHFVETREGEPKKCLGYCSVNQYCKWYQDYQKEVTK